MIRVEEFEYMHSLNKFLKENRITREQLIDIKYTGTGHCTHFLLIYETPIEPSIHEVNCITSSDFTYRGFGL